FVSIVIVKQLFGGLGKNFANPAIVGRIVLMLSFTTQMTTWPTPRGVDGTTGATPLNLMENGGHLVSLKALFLGTTGGCLGEVSALALIIGGVFLIVKKIIDPIIPCSFIGTVFVFSLLYYGIKGSDAGALHMALYNILAGGVMLGAIFCATDYVTSPIMNNGKLIFGIGCGLFTMLIRLFCNYPEGVSFSILFMNLFVPLIDRTTMKRYYASLYGGAKK
ncbi:MAG: RnfABCDGE type electron transport complex subunit D, partial [Eubacterium sp.]